LFSIRERVQLLGGRMKIKSAPGKGSTVFIAVPDSPITADGALRAEDDRDQASAIPSPSYGSVLRVMVADDHEVVRQGLATLLDEQQDIQFVGEAANGREAVDMANRLRPDVVVMDVSMPLMNGDEATRQTKMHLPETRVIALSMHAEEGMMERMRRAGADSYVLKTAPAEELLAAIRGHPVHSLS
jgi:CheY-like chemotaxis protein